MNHLKAKKKNAALIVTITNVHTLFKVIYYFFLVSDGLVTTKSKRVLTLFFYSDGCQGRFYIIFVHV